MPTLDNRDYVGNERERAADLSGVGREMTGGHMLILGLSDILL